MSTSISRSYSFIDDKNNGVPITASRVDTELDAIITKLNQKVIISASAPSSPINGMLWYDTTNSILKFYASSAWKDFPTATNPQQGDIFYFNGSKFATLPSGASGYVLKTAPSAAPSWTNTVPIAENISISGQQDGDLLVKSGTAWQRLSGGTSGYFLKTLGLGALPLWDTLSLAGLSNVLFCYGSGINYSGGAYGAILNSSTVAGKTAIASLYWANGILGVYQTVLATKFKKISGISTLTIWCKIWGQSGSSTTNVMGIVGSVSGTVAGTTGAVVPEWKSLTVDVSGLSNGTTYDVSIQIMTDLAGLAYISDVIAIGS